MGGFFIYFLNRDIPELPYYKQIRAKIGTHGNIALFITIIFWAK